MDEHIATFEKPNEAIPLRMVKVMNLPTLIKRPSCVRLDPIRRAWLSRRHEPAFQYLDSFVSFGHSGQLTLFTPLLPLSPGRMRPQCTSGHRSPGRPAATVAAYHDFLSAFNRRPRRWNTKGMMAFFFQRARERHLNCVPCVCPAL